MRYFALTSKNRTWRRNAYGFPKLATASNWRHDINTNDSTPHASIHAANQAGSFYFPKPALTLRQQVSHLVEAGLIINDVRFAEDCLANTNYYRLRGFWLTLENENGRFREGAKFEDIWSIYELDQELRLWLWRAIGPIEVKLRAQFAYFLAHYVGPLGYLREETFKDQNSFLKSIRNFERERDRAQRQSIPYDVHNLNQYGNLPVWAAVEIMSFGTLSQLYGNLRPETGETEKHPDVYTSIANAFGMKPTYLRSWMHHLTTVRNIAGHHDRFYNRAISIRPKLLARDAKYQSNKEFPTFLIIRNIYELSWPNKWPVVGGELASILASRPNVDIKPMGFPKNWKVILNL